MNHIIEAIHRIEDYTKSLTYAEFYQNTRDQDAVIRNFEVIGEASRNIAERFRRHTQHPQAEGFIWTSRQDDAARALVLFEDHLAGPALKIGGSPNPLLLSDGSAILEVLFLARRLGVLLTP